MCWKTFVHHNLWGIKASHGSPKMCVLDSTGGTNHMGCLACWSCVRLLIRTRHWNKVAMTHQVLGVYQDRASDKILSNSDFLT